LVDGLLIAFGSTPRWSLPAPAQPLSEDVPHPSWVVCHARNPLDYLRHALQRPEVVGVAIGLSAFRQLHLDLSELLSAELWQAASSTCAAQAIPSGPTPRCTPVGNDLV